MSASTAAERFRSLHDVGRLLVLPNAWDAGSARVIESCGASAIATTSSGVAWACGYPDGDSIPANASPVQFGASTICSFSPIGESTSGTIYLTDAGGLAYAVRVFGGSGKVRLLRYNAGRRRWEQL